MKQKVLNMLLLLGISATFIQAKGNLDYLNEAYLKEQFTFKDGEKMKFEKCPMMYRGKVCYYVWGKESSMDSMLPIPEGNQVRVNYEKDGRKNFDMVLKSLTDLEKVEGVGKQAFWSVQRTELFVLLENGMILYVYIHVFSERAPKEKAVTIAKHILGQLK